jgi:hypothetical protein
MPKARTPVFIVNVQGYAYLVPFGESDAEVFLKTIIPSRRATKRYLKSGDPTMAKLSRE